MLECQGFYPKKFARMGLAPVVTQFHNWVTCRDAKFLGILRVVNFHWEYREFCGNIGNFEEYSEILGILK